MIHFSRFVKENITFSVVLKDDIGEGEVKRMQKKLEAEPFIKSIEYISKEQASKNWKRNWENAPKHFRF